VAKSFVAGADISEFANFSIEQGSQLQQKVKKNYLILSKIKKHLLLQNSYG
jgi:enoyl-CoA hydratase/carnithine racemase